MALIDLNYQKKFRDFSKEELVNTIKSFNIKPNFSVGIWYFSPGGGRFHDRFVPAMTIEERINKLAEMSSMGVKGVEAHYPAEINWDNIDLYKNLQKETGIQVVGIPFSHFFDKQFEFGSLSNPDPEIRKNAIEIAVDAMKIAHELGTPNVISWPGMDGYTYDVGTIYPWMWKYYDESMAKIIDEFPGKVRIALEPKPYEPAINNIFRTTAEGILAAQRIESLLENEENKSLVEKGVCLFGLNPEFGHVRMGYETGGAAYSLVGMHGRLAHIHLNSQPLGNYDQDLNVGVTDIQQGYAMLYSLMMMNYNEWWGIDINPEHMPVNTAVEINIAAIQKMLKKLQNLPHDDIIECYLHPSEHRGDLEKILIEHLF